MNPEDIIDITPEVKPRRAKLTATQKVAESYRTNKVFSSIVSGVLTFGFVVAPFYLASSHLINQNESPIQTEITGYSNEAVPAKGRAPEVKIKEKTPRNPLAAYLSNIGPVNDPIPTLTPLASSTLEANPMTGVVKDVDEEVGLESWTLDTMPRAWPVEGRRTSSGYGYRTDPITKTRRFHTGTDISLGCGTPVLAAASGYVKESGATGGAYGIQIILDHGSNIFTSYAHLSSISVTRGDYVEIGDKIGGVGTTGRSTGCHLHFELASNGKFLNPAGWLNRTGNYGPVVSAWSEYRTGSSPNGYTGEISRDAVWEPIKDFAGDIGTLKETDEDVVPDVTIEPTIEPTVEASVVPTMSPSLVAAPEPSASVSSKPTSPSSETPAPTPSATQTVSSPPASSEPTTEPTTKVTIVPEVPESPVTPPKNSIEPVTPPASTSPPETKPEPSVSKVPEPAPTITSSTPVEAKPSPIVTTSASENPSN